MRKQLQSLALTLFAITVVSAAGAEKVAEKPPSDDEIRKKLVGIWVVDNKISETRSITGTSTFAADGRSSAAVSFNIDGKKETIQTEGKWEVKEGVLVETITKSSSKIPPIGLVTRDRIIRVNDAELVYITEKDKTVTRKRGK